MLRERNYFSLLSGSGADVRYQRVREHWMFGQRLAGEVAAVLALSATFSLVACKSRTSSQTGPGFGEACVPSEGCPSSSLYCTVSGAQSPCAGQAPCLGAPGNLHCSRSCKETSDCTNPSIEMTCLKTCSATNSDNLVGLCWDTQTYSEYVTHDCHDQCALTCARDPASVTSTCGRGLSACSLTTSRVGDTAILQKYCTVVGGLTGGGFGCAMTSCTVGGVYSGTTNCSGSGGCSLSWGSGGASCPKDSSDGGAQEADAMPSASDVAIVASSDTPLKAGFTATGGMITARSDHTATSLPSGMVLIAGGYSGGAYLVSAELYDPGAGMFTATGSMTVARRDHTATLLPNGIVLIAGGHSGSGDLASAELYDPKAGTFTATGSMTAPRYNHTATLLPNGMVLIAGGVSGSADLASAELYDPGAGMFTATGSMTVARGSNTATLLPNGIVLIAGGYSGRVALASAELYAPGAGTFTGTANMTVERRDHTATLLPNGMVLIAGGNSGGAYLASAELYDPEAGTSTATGSMTGARYSHTATLLSNGMVLIAGGYPDGVGLASGLLYK